MLWPCSNTSSPSPTKPHSHVTSIHECMFSFSMFVYSQCIKKYTNLLFAVVNGWLRCSHWFPIIIQSLQMKQEKHKWLFRCFTVTRMQFIYIEWNRTRRKKKKDKKNMMLLATASNLLALCKWNENLFSSNKCLNLCQKFYVRKITPHLPPSLRIMKVLQCIYPLYLY